MFIDHEDASNESSGSPEESKSLKDISSLYLNKKFADVTFIVAGKKLHAHKAILAAKSKGFENLFDKHAEEEEITILNTSLESFRILLKYVYTGKINTPSDYELVLQVLILANQYSFNELASHMVGKIKTIFDEKNILFFLNQANDKNLDELREACHSVIDANASYILSSDFFNHLTEKSLIELLKRNTFMAPEIEIFKSVAKWCKNNSNNLVLDCVRLELLTVFEIVSIVWPTKLVNAEKLLEIIFLISDPNPKASLPRRVLCNQHEQQLYMYQSIASFQLGINVISRPDIVSWLAGNTDVNKCFTHLIDGKNNIVINLSKPCCINHIRMRLKDANFRNHYSYYIETSLDLNNWNRIVDYSKYACRSIQNLYFDQQISQYIKIVGTNSSSGSDFSLVSFRAFYKNKIPEVVNAVICPKENVATLENRAVVLAGCNPMNLLNGDHQSYTCHQISSNSSGLIVQLAQPYIISNMRVLLRCFKDCSYKYLIETSVNKTDWEIAIDRRNVECRSWQDLHFAKRVVVFIKITGTGSSMYKWFRCAHLECPLQLNY